MKIWYFTTLLIWVTFLRIINGEFRYKVRGPTPPLNRPPQMPNYHKKFHGHPMPPPPQHHMQRMPIRPRPIPAPHIQLNHNVPKLPQNVPILKRPIPPNAAIPLPVASNVRNVWKAPQNTYKVLKEKPFVSSPAVTKTEYDFHIQTNNIPNHLNTIKQVDEKGPIHTIPAPKLSPADKPKIIENVRVNPQVEQQEQVRTIVQVQKAHQYQVTEPADFHQKPSYNPQEEIVNDFGNPLRTQDFNLNQQFKLPTTTFSQQSLYPNLQEQISSQELFKILNTYPQQQQLLDTYPLPLLQQPQLQQHLTQHQENPQQSILTTPQLFEQQVSYMTQIQHDINSNEKIHVQPEYHSFNYEEQGSKSQARVDTEIEDDFPQIRRADVDATIRNPLEALAQAQYVQHFFDTRSENLDVGHVEPDAKPAPQLIFEDDDDSSSYYAKLPSKKAVDALTSLQEAGKANNKLRQTVKQIAHKIPMTIYVPDETQEENIEQFEESDNITPELNDSDYDVTYQNEENVEEKSKQKSKYSNKLKPKNH